ncbi:Imm21 family immunity protein [Hydrocarboniphaga sp.]|uniref:Imm21 family immunity protein n=1 Tax=Hydrocarboniphaga sp. TaxID=2033016 RepID=UPI002633CA04|nr:Imm21 family immunity protein [Hydrocarboniphaga sp.]
MKWIKSGGGPLVCVELELADSWLGVTGNSISRGPDRECANDYERACRVRDYLGKVSVGNRDALILGDMPLETMIWHPPGRLPRIVRVFYGDPGVDVTKVLESAAELHFDDPAEVLAVEAESTSMVVFDSAYPGSDASVERLSFELPVGRYVALTKQFLPDDRTSVLVHMFEPTQ